MGAFVCATVLSVAQTGWYEVHAHTKAELVSNEQVSSFIVHVEGIGWLHGVCCWPSSSTMLLRLAHHRFVTLGADALSPSRHLQFPSHRR
jgi:hypothetical protein